MLITGKRMEKGTCGEYDKGQSRYKNGKVSSTMID
jgi:hypothetical protein